MVHTRGDPCLALRVGAAHGALVWLAYGLLEPWVTSSLPWGLASGSHVDPVHPAFAALAMGLYALAGAALGAVAGPVALAACRRLGALRSWPDDALARLAAIATLAAAVAANAAWARHGQALAIAGLAGLLLSIPVLAARIAPGRARALLAPWLPATLALGLVAVLHEVLFDAAAPARAAAAAGFTAVAVGLALATGAGAPAARRGPGRAVAILGAAAVTLGAAWGVLDRERAPPPWPGPRAPLPAAAPVPGAPDVILVSLDTVRPDHLSVYGYERDTSPHLAAFAARARVYRRAVAAGDMTLSAHASILTGLYPRQHGAHLMAERRFGQPLDAGVPTLAELLAGAGYRTVAVAANSAYLAPRFGLQRGFEYFDSRWRIPLLSGASDLFLRERLRRTLRALGLGRGEAVPYRRAATIVDESLGLLDRLGERQPVLLFVNFMDAHAPFAPPAPFDRRFPGRLEGFTALDQRRLGRQVLRGKRRPSEAERAHLVSQYDGEIAYLDAQLGRLFAGLHERGRLERALVVVTSDHGEAFGRRGLLGHGLSVYQDQIDAVLIVRPPDGREQPPEGGDGPQPLVSHVDILPTVLDLARLAVPEGLPGRSLRRLGRDPPRIVVGEHYPHSRLVATHPRFEDPSTAVFFGDRKLIASVDGRRELYDLAADPGEHADLHGRDGATAAAMEARLRAWRGQPAAATGRPADVDPATLERLRALGYAD